MKEEYKKLEFCIDVSCQHYWPESTHCQEHCGVNNKSNCNFTAKEFHHWLKDNGYKIVKDNP